MGLAAQKASGLCVMLGSTELPALGTLLFQEKTSLILLKWQRAMHFLPVSPRNL